MSDNKINILLPRLVAARSRLNDSFLLNKQTAIDIAEGYMNRLTLFDPKEIEVDSLMSDIIHEVERFCEAVETVGELSAAQSLIVGHWQIRIVSLLRDLGFITIDVSQYLAKHQDKMEDDDVQDAYFVIGSASMFSDTLTVLMGKNDKEFVEMIGKIEKAVAQTESFVATAKKAGFGTPLH